MTDLSLLRSGELGVTQVQAQTDAATEFVDAYNPGTDMTVIDSGWIALPNDAVPALVEEAGRCSLTVETEAVS